MTARVHARLCAALGRLTGSTQVSGARVRPWASITFSGARHWLSLHVPRDTAVQAIAALSACDLALPGHFVADLAITQRTEDAQGCVLAVEVLTVAQE